MIHYEKTAVARHNFMMSGENPAITGIIPEGYMSGDEFERRVKERITKFYKDNGLL